MMLQSRAPPVQPRQEFHPAVRHEGTMARLPRIVVSGCPHHVTARGNRREPIFFEDGDQDIYCDMLAEQVRKAEVEVWAYCLMPNQVHLILCPGDENGLARALGARRTGFEVVEAAERTR
jgi:putative transposase